ncbi:MAG TPA: tetratricopeptide repeat protein [Opitutaceae bacterium]|nr:tetratricopeptide repeat protein [Opitutaceae bacterium]
MRVPSLRRLTPILALLLGFGFGAGPAAAADLDAAVALFQAQRYPDARAAFEKIAAAAPQNAAAHYYLGRIALYRDDAETADAELEKAAALDPKNSDYFFWLGSAYGIAAREAHSLFKASHCRTALLKAVELNPDNLEAREALVTFYRQAPFFVGGSLAKAHAQAAEIKKRDPLLGAMAEAEICISEKKYDDAFAAFETLLKEHPDQIAALYQIGFISATTGLRLDRGEAALKAYLAHTPGDTQPSLAYAHLRLGNIYEREKKPDDARAEYQAALAQDPRFALAARALAKLR